MRTSLLHSFINHTTHRLLAALVILSVFYVLLSPSITEGYAGLGGYISEKLLGRSGAASSSLFLSSSTSGPVVIGRGPTVSTATVTGAGISGGAATATLNGSLTSLAGFPVAQVQFEWGYDPATLTNTTTLVTVSVTGAFTATLTGYDPGQEVYYRAVAYTDGVDRGAITHFHATSGSGVGYFMLWSILPIVIGLGTFLVVVLLARGGNWVAVMIAALIGVVTIVIVQNVLRSIWGG